VRIAARNDEDLRQGEGHPLAELVLPSDGGAGEGRGGVVAEEELVLIAVVVSPVDVSSDGIALRLDDVRRVEGGRQSELLVDPAFISKLANLSDVAVSGPEGGLHQEPRGIYRRRR